MSSHSLTGSKMTTQLDSITTQRTKTKKPSDWAIVMHNDDTTPMDFVVSLLSKIFHLPYEHASELMLTVHFNGRAVAGIFSREVAEQKYSEAMTIITTSGYQLKITIEEQEK